MLFEFFLKEAWAGFRRNEMMSMVSIITVTVSLVVFGAFLLVAVNMNNMAENLGSKMDIVAYVNKDMDEYGASSFIVEILKITGVESVNYISKQQAWEDFKNDYGSRLSLDEIVKENPLPNAFVIKVKSPQMVSPVAKSVSNIAAVDEVRYSGNMADRFQSLLDAIRIAGIVLVALLVFATLLIIFNTIKLTVISRQTDIAIMKLVGATDSFIKWPFIIEGILIGMIGSALSFIILKFSYDIIAIKIQEALPFVPLIVSKSRLFWIYGGVCALGILLGMFGALLSVNSILKEKNNA